MVLVIRLVYGRRGYCSTYKMRNIFFLPLQLLPIFFPFQCKYAASEVIQLLDDIIVLFRSEKALCHVSPPVTIVGDLNGQFQDLVRILNIKNEKCRVDDAEKPVFSSEKLDLNEFHQIF